MHPACSFISFILAPEGYNGHQRGAFIDLTGKTRERVFKKHLIESERAQASKSGSSARFPTQKTMVLCYNIHGGINRRSVLLCRSFSFSGDLPRMLSRSTFSGPDQEKKVSGGRIFLIVFLLLIQTGIILFALSLAVRTRVRVVWLDPYLQLDIQGANGYAVTRPQFDEDRFRSDLEDTLRAGRSSLSSDAADSLSNKAAESISFEYYVRTADGETGMGVTDAEEEDSEENLQDALDLPVPGISNGDTVTVYADISEEVWTDLREMGFYLAFECDPVSMTAENLPEANPYDPFEDLSVSFYGMDGTGTLNIDYNNSYPLRFNADPSDNLKNGDTINVEVTFSDDYDLNSLVANYHIMPTRLQNQYTVTGLYVNPNGIEEFSEETRENLMREGREAARAFLEEEYEENERFTLDDAGMYFAVSNEVVQDSAETAGEEGTGDANVSASSGIRNYLYCLFRVNYSNDSGDELEYYYYIRFENLLLDDSGEVTTDFRQVEYPHKPSIPLFGEALGDGAEVSVGFLSFRTLAGYETLNELITRVIDPLRTSFTVSSY